MRTVALRFAENFAPNEGTIAAHEAVIERHGFAWYGKMGAAVSQKAAADLMAYDEPRILLIHSGAAAISYLIALFAGGAITKGFFS